MSGRTLLARLLGLPVLFGGFAVLSAWEGDVSWPGVATLTLVMFVILLLIDWFFERRDRVSADS